MGVTKGIKLGCLTWSQDLASALNTSALAHSLCCLKLEGSDWNENLCHFLIGSSGFQVCWLIRVGALHLPAELKARAGFAHNCTCSHLAVALLSTHLSPLMEECQAGSMEMPAVDLESWSGSLLHHHHVYCFS